VCGRLTRSLRFRIAFNAFIDYILSIQQGRTFLATLTIRNLDHALKERLRVRAAEHGCSMEAEARRILQAALGELEHPPRRNLYERIHARFTALGGIDLDLPPRTAVREPPQFD
jgi:antitoxin FitA